MRLEEILDKNKMNSYWFIVHTFDKVFIGNQDNQDNLNSSWNKILELHIFNGEKEIFLRRVDNELVDYQPLVHDETRDFISREYSLAAEFKGSGYKEIKTREYVAYDENNLAYIEKTILAELV